MIPAAAWLVAMISLPAAGCALCMVVREPRRMLAMPVFSSAGALGAAMVLAVRLHAAGRFLMFGQTFLIDALSLFHIFLVNGIFLVTALYAAGYFKPHSAIFTGRAMRRYCMLWQGFQAMLLLVLVSNNIGIMWVALEATTLLSAFLILSDANPLSLEAMWKYLLVCSVGIVFAFMGTLLTVAAARSFPGGEGVFLFTGLSAHTALLNSRVMLFAFIFIVVGFGTKAGLAPMHTWLPDAHSQAPTPVSAVFSGVMLNCALYCIMRYLPIAEAALGHAGGARSIMLLFGCTSLIFAAVFVPVQHDLKRLLAYCSVEHIGIIALGLGLGGVGTYAALLHTVNHSVAKTLSFFSAGHIAESYGTRDMRTISGASRRLPLWGAGFFISVLVLIGVAPFSVFMSEFLIVKEAFYRGRFGMVALFLFCALVIFMSALRSAMRVSFGKADPSPEPGAKSRLTDIVTVCGGVALLLLLGLWIPTPFTSFLSAAAGAINGRAAP
jgi:hydrogenase-4 component F